MACCVNQRTFQDSQGDPERNAPHAAKRLMRWRALVVVWLDQVVWLHGLGDSDPDSRAKCHCGIYQHAIGTYRNNSLSGFSKYFPN